MRDNFPDTEPHGERLARVQQMCTEGYGGLSQRDKDDIREVYHSLLDVTRDSGILLGALERSVKLQSHYAKLLNMYDGGERLQFATAQEWIARLQVDRVMAHSCPDCDQTCYCLGDCDDAQLDGTEEQEACTHCLLRPAEPHAHDFDDLED